MCKKPLGENKMTNANDIIKKTEDLLVATYNSQPVVMDHGDGVYAWDTDGKKYLDFAAGIAVASLGHAHPKMLDTINTQAARMMTCQASYATKEKLAAAEILIDNSCFDLVYFSNSGAESVEASLKCARKWAYDNKGEMCNEIIAFNSSFHGRTYGAASVTAKRKTQPFFAPYLDGVHFADFNNIDSVKALVNDRTAAIIVEPVQGEGGLTPATPQFLRDLRKLCDKENICLIFDEIQAGMGRLGTFFAYESFECCPDCGEDEEPDHENASPIEPDIACLAKGMGGGFPVGAMVAKHPYGDAIVVGTHGTTYGGNPLACAVAATVMSEILSDGFLEHANKVSKILFDGLAKIQRESNKITDIRGKGLMIGVDTSFDIKGVLRGLQKNGMMATQAGKATLRLTPPLILNEEQAEEALSIIEKTLKELD
jgi:acetylornithine/N-succinyldiaminopimelate aminotransferase